MRDPGGFFSEAAWNAMGLLGPSVIVDDTPAPYDDSHFLQTDIDVPSGGEHRSVIRNSQLEPDGTPTFQEVWEYTCCSP